MSDLVDAFADVDEKKAFGEFKKVEYLKTDPGQYLIRFLTPTKKYYTHYFNRNSVACLGEGCPVCENNKKIIFEHPDDFRTVAGYSPKRERFFANVLYEDKVYVLSSGPRLIDDIKTMAKTVRNEGNEIVNPLGYDWLLIVNGKGREKDTTPVPQYRGTEQLLTGHELFDLENLVPVVTAEEMLELVGGMSLKDVFAIRKAQKAGEEMDFPVVADEIQKDIEDAVNDIFKE